MRYLGMSLGMATVLGLTMVIGTLAPPIFHGTIDALANSHGGWITFVGIALALLGVVVVGNAGRVKERELTAEQARATIAEFNFKRGVLVAAFSGVMSSCFAFGLDTSAALCGISSSSSKRTVWAGVLLLVIATIVIGAGNRINEL
jgi:L-rhamnose-H+ transport protein